MSVFVFPATVQGQADALAVANPKTVAFTANAFVVANGADYVDPVSIMDTDKFAARSYAKLAALRAMTPEEIQAWAAANVTTIAQARDAITTLAVAVSILSREI